MEEKPASAPVVNSDIPSKSKKRFWILVVICILGLVLLKMSFVFLFIGMMPAMVAYLIDHDKNKYSSSTVAALNFAGVFSYLMEIYMQGGTFEAVKERLFDANVWLVMYGAAAAGWFLVWFSPIVASVALDGIYRGRILHLETMQKKAEEEWGKQVTGHGHHEE